MSVFRAGGYSFELGSRTYIMGIVNVTPDSFSDGGKYYDPSSALEHARSLVSDGADIIDIGAVSTRPGAEEVSADEEISRLKPVFESGITSLGVPVSVDTFSVPAAEMSLSMGASVINDVSGSFSSEIAALCKRYGASYIVTHNPLSSSAEKAYPDGVIADVRAYFLDCAAKAADASLSPENLCLDPGIGFSKSRQDDAEIIKNIQWLKIKPYALLFGASRKRITACGGDIPEERDFSTSAANAAAVAGGADIVRVHNVKAAKGACAFADRIYRSK